MTKLSVNLNKIALIRNSRYSDNPSILNMAEIAIRAGADGITVHPRPDQRHIRPEDCDELAQMLSVKFMSEVEFNIEGNPFEGQRDGYPGFMELIRGTKPDQCTLVPDDSNQLTSDHGWDLKQDGERLKPIIAELKHLGCCVSLFMDVDSDDIEMAAELGADRIEFYTEAYADAFGTEQQEQAFLSLKAAAKRATNAGLGINAGHDLNLQNLELIASIPKLQEVSIGHALISDALIMGLENTVKAYKTTLSSNQ